MATNGTATTRTKGHTSSKQSKQSFNSLSNGQTVWKTGSNHGRSQPTKNLPKQQETRRKIQKKTVSKETLKKVETIKQSSVSYLKKLEDIEDGDSSSSEDDEEYKKKEEQLLSNTLKTYYTSLMDANSASAGKMDPNVMKSSPEFLSTDSFLTSNTTCLICISSIRHNHPVWSCIKCHCLFHLQCIQHWVVDGVQRKSSFLSPDLFPNQEVQWSCPKCRHEYPQSQCPQKYFCYCGKVSDPPHDPWLLPHTCGESCDKPLVPECGHRCLSLCHPGPCPPCPKNVLVKCYCGRSQPTMRRCGLKGWSCGRVCRKPLNCGQHICEEKCHEGECPPCSYTLDQPCKCERVTKERLCTELDWSCGQKCKKKYQCGHHVCEKECHVGECGDCPRAGERVCPCGRTRHTLPCTKDVPTCGDTCGKLLSCGVHKCMRVCHHGACGNCLEQVLKKCRCGNKTKSLSCGTEFLCDTKCAIMKRCGRHICKRKCCSGNCPPCELTCGKQLQCGRHKCSAPCHLGRCYPCVLMTSLSCNCGKTKIQVPCEQRQRARLPRCQEQCVTPPTCHHPTRTPHLCHSRECPPCHQRCGRSLNCGHECPQPCHSEPKHRPKEDAPMDATIPWAKMKTILREYSEQVIIIPCPPCMAPVKKACLGEHEINVFPCSQVKDYPCTSICGRRLACGNHLCQYKCHKVLDSVDDTQAGSNCMSCDLLCQRERPKGCTHKCHLECHPDDCPKCEIYLRFRCHCSTMPILFKCFEWTSANSEEKSKLLACNSQCIKILSCGHRCSFNCHPGQCSSTDNCTNEVTLYCSCKRIKKQVPCNKTNELRPVCNSECERIKEEKRKERERIKAEKEAEAKKKEMEEKEALLRRLEGKQKKKRKRKENTKDDTDDIGFISKHWSIIMIGITVLVTITVAILLYFAIGLS